MNYRPLASGAVLFAAWFGLAAPARAVIEVLTPLKLFINDSSAIVVAKVERLDAEQRAAVLVTSTALKGKPAFRRLPLSLAGDTVEQAAQLEERLAIDTSVILFIDEHNLAIGYSNGTWFQAKLTGQGANLRASFTHFEPSLRRTFTGKTADLQTVLADVIAGKRKPPPANPQEKPGLGPKAERTTKP
jgi:hypothetical protein